jgi:putative ABC transport system ATP-binding protein
MPLYDLKSVSRRFPDGGRLALDGVSLAIERGEFVAVLGTSGSGKSTLLHVMGALDREYTGEVTLDGHELRGLTDTAAAALRQRMLGFVFQGFHLVPDWRVRHNVALPASFSPTPVPDLTARVDAVLDRVGLAGRGDDYPTALSGGQRQRVAIARALLLKPPVLLCDEPTGSLDADTGASVLSLFQSLHRDEGYTVIVVTHEERVTAIAQRVLRIESGKLVDDRRNAP